MFYNRNKILIMKEEWSKKDKFECMEISRYNYLNIVYFSTIIKGGWNEEVFK
ncbi:hypothetical protein BACI71_30305 [Bacillus mycoides]|uniref:Uncharacterized protein n=1 Tax=Bacillus mycoides TaxID=1405 RepID=A0A653WXD1_BACMY|nr:hypothetical protein BACI71_30305 [Bacillus mycoides]